MLADADCVWSSYPASSCDMPRQWYEFGDGYIKLKDIGRGYYKNELLTNVTFKYLLPLGQSNPKSRIIREFTKPVDQRCTVKLYRVAHGHDNYLGEWIITYATNDDQPHIILHRKTEQHDESGRRPLKRRSFSEFKHEAVLNELFPGCTVTFESECASGLRTNAIEDGRVNKWASDFYTVDYVVSNIARGFFLCVESKSCIEDLDDVARAKCRQLRDRGYRRVIALAGHGTSLRVYDFGTDTSGEHEYSRTEFEDTVRFFG